MTIRPVRSRIRINVLNDDEIERIHGATLRVLDRVGVEVRSDSMLAELAALGARIDEATSRVMFDPILAEELLALVPRTVSFAARDPENDIVIDGETGYLGVDGCAAEILDWQTDQRRPSSKADIAMSARLADAIPQLAYIWQPVTAREEHELSSPLHEIQAEWQNTSKHIMQMTAVNADQARGVVDMAQAVVGGSGDLRARPVVSAFQCSISPLTYDAGPVEAAKVYGAAGVPCGFMVMPITSATAPASIAGTLVGGNAEVVGGVLLHQLMNPGAPTFYGSCSTMMDMYSGATACGGPEDIYFQAANAQLARRYGIPSNIGTFCTGGKASDFQAGAENMASGMASTLAGVDLYCGAGLLYAARVHSPVQMLLDADLFEMIAVFAEGYTIDEEQLAVEVIEHVGPGGHYLAEDHTRTHMRDFYYPAYFDRSMWEDWEEAGKPDPTVKAKERIREILASHEPLPLPEDVDTEFQRIVDRLDEKVRAEDDHEYD